MRELVRPSSKTDGGGSLTCSKWATMRGALSCPSSGHTTKPKKMKHKYDVTEVLKKAVEAVTESAAAAAVLEIIDAVTFDEAGEDEEE